jgi:peroxiredoxin Q/BCP
MAQLRQDYIQFVEREAEILVIGHENAHAFASFWMKNFLPFTGLPDPKGSVLKKYGQEVNIFKLGRMPAQAIIDKQEIVRFVHYGNSMTDIPENSEILAILDELNQQERQPYQQLEGFPIKE